MDLINEQKSVQFCYCCLHQPRNEIIICRHGIFQKLCFFYLRQSHFSISSRSGLIISGLRCYRVCIQTQISIISCLVYKTDGETFYTQVQCMCVCSDMCICISRMSVYDTSDGPLYSEQWYAVIHNFMIHNKVHSRKVHWAFVNSYANSCFSSFFFNNDEILFILLFFLVILII